MCIYVYVHIDAFTYMRFYSYVLLHICACWRRAVSWARAGTALYRQPPTRRDLASAIRARFAPLGGVELEIPPRSPIRKPPRFD